MSKRFTDTTMYDKKWFRSLPLEAKCLWDWLLKKCDAAGIVDIDFGLASFQIGADVSEITLKLFGDRVVLLGDNKYFLPKFIDFQYGELSENCKPHLAVIKILNKNKIKWKKIKGYPKGIRTLEDKDKEKDKEKEKEKEKDTLNFDAIYKNYPRKDGKSKGIESCLAKITTSQKYQDLQKAVENYKQLCLEEKTERKYIKMFSTFMNCWEDFIDTQEVLGQTKEYQKKLLDQQMIAFFQDAERKADDNQG